MSAFDDELRSLSSTIKEKKAAIADAELQLKKIEHDVGVLAKEKVAAANFISGLEKTYEWIADESNQFGKAGGQYDFEKMNIPELKERARELETAQKGMKKKVNPKEYLLLSSERTSFFRIHYEKVKGVDGLYPSY